MTCKVPFLLTILLISLLFSAGQPVGAENWTEFRGPTGQGYSTEKNIPARWSDTENVRWKMAVPGIGWSSPVVFNGRVYLTTAVDQGTNNSLNQSLRVVCLDASTGKSVWNVEVFRQDATTTDPIHSKNSHASATPLTDGKHLFVHYGTLGTACLRLDGKIVWKTRKLKYSPRHGNGESPVLVDDMLVVSCDGADEQFVVALDRGTGKIRWKRLRPDVVNPSKFSFSTPLVITVGGEKQVVCPGTDLVIAYEPANGREIWTVKYDGYSVVPRPIYAHGLVYVCTGWSPPNLLVIRPDGRGDVTDTHVQWTSTRNIPNTPSPLMIGNDLYFISDRGVASCVDAKTGTVHWQQRVGGNYSASPVYADGKIYFQSEDGVATVIKPATRYVELAKNRFPGARTLASYAVADSAIFIRTDKHLYRIEQR